ncbi:hypothetical protein NEF87_001293 [Candidatus Lokiarchaeum ossiferum]|uniref:DNRLRE domain-containing protein n=1 Tax=Candidatus Lokiarchaeum ossiferum TaxID=2951803 RepID=A0ABY6HNB4_9ARCH|nr:hypothetical protein NEF87_001293 [Candidatus Lokiarchaeum sp. B-35]
MDLLLKENRKFNAFLLLLCIAIVGISSIYFSQDEEQHKLCNCVNIPPSMASVSYQVEDEAIYFFTNPNDTSNINYIQFFLSYNETIFSDLRSYVTFNNSLRFNAGFYVDIRSNNKDTNFHIQQRITPQYVNLNKNWYRSESIAWIQWVNKTNSDVYLDPFEGVKIHVLFGSQELITWGDSFTIYLASSRENVDQMLEFRVDLPLEMPTASNQIMGQYSKAETRMY